MSWKFLWRLRNLNFAKKLTVSTYTVSNNESRKNRNKCKGQIKSLAEIKIKNILYNNFLKQVSNLAVVVENNLSVNKKIWWYLECQWVSLDFYECGDIGNFFWPMTLFFGINFLNKICCICFKNIFQNCGLLGAYIYLE